VNARYYDSARGQFLSEDPVFLALGNPSQVQQLSKQDQKRFLMDPQQMNSYNYAIDNPMKNKAQRPSRIPAPVKQFIGGA
jgi:hypothetical protein